MRGGHHSRRMTSTWYEGVGLASSPPANKAVERQLAFGPTPPPGGASGTQRQLPVPGARQSAQARPVPLCSGMLCPVSLPRRAGRGAAAALWSGRFILLAGGSRSFGWTSPAPGAPARGRAARRLRAAARAARPPASLLIAQATQMGPTSRPARPNWEDRPTCLGAVLAPVATLLDARTTTVRAEALQATRLRRRAAGAPPASSPPSLAAALAPAAAVAVAAGDSARLLRPLGDCPTCQRAKRALGSAGLRITSPGAGMTGVRRQASSSSPLLTQSFRQRLGSPAQRQTNLRAC